MATQVLIVHGQLPFAIKLKQALERAGAFEAHPFTSAEGAADYLRDHVQDIAVVDFTLPDAAGDEVVERLRRIQNNLAVIATPALHPDQMKAYGVLASLDDRFNAKDLINLINNYFTQNERPSYLPPSNTALLDRASRTAPRPADDVPEHTSLDDVLADAGRTNIFEPPHVEGDTPPGPVEELVWEDDDAPSKPESSFDDVLSALPPDAPETPPVPRSQFTDLVDSMRGGEQEHRPLPTRQQQFVEYILSGNLDSLMEDVEQPPAEESVVPEDLFDHLSQEEPPPPTFEESGTVSDLVTGVHDRSFRNVLSIMRGEEPIEDSEEIEPPAEPPNPPANADDFVVEPRPTPPTPAPTTPKTYQFDFEEEHTPAQIVLARTLEQSVSGGGFSLEDLLSNIDAQLPLHRPKVQPLPSWLRDQQRPQENAFYVDEPDFLPEDLPEEVSVEPSEDLYPDHTTQAGLGQAIVAEPEGLETEWLDDPQRAFGETVMFPDTLPEEVPAEPTILHGAAIAAGATILHEVFQPDEAAMPTDPAEGWHKQLAEEDFNTQFELMAAFEVHDETGVSSGALYTEVPMDAPPPEAAPVQEPEAEPASTEDPYLAQLALSLTQVSLETTAEAILLARDQQIVAYAGEMPREEIEELRGTIADDWNAAPDEVRIRFITAQGSGKDYMLYSRRTEDNFTLSLIFAGTMPLRDIRRQGQRLVAALNSVPEAPQAPTPAPTMPTAAPVDAALLTPYAWVWLLRDPQGHLDSAVSQAISAGLNIQLREKQWQIQSLEVHEDYVYLLADMPGEEAAYQVVRDLKRRSAEIAHAQNPAYAPDQLWSDSYLVVTPGRALDVEEIQQFINFDRMA